MTCRIFAAALVAAALMSVPAWTQPDHQPATAPPAAPEATEASTESEAVGIVAVLSAGAVTSLDMSYPGPVTMTEITQDLQKISQWTGWTLSPPTYDDSGGTHSAHVQVSGGELGTGILDDLIWPLVAALAERGRLGIVVMGAEVATPALKIENRFVTLEQSGGQGVQSYQAYVRDPGFGTLEALKKPGDPQAAQTSPQRRLALAWVLVIVASIACGVAVYLFMGKAGRKP